MEIVVREAHSPGRTHAPGPAGSSPLPAPKSGLWLRTSDSTFTPRPFASQPTDKPAQARASSGLQPPAPPPAPVEPMQPSPTPASTVPRTLTHNFRYSGFNFDQLIPTFTVGPSQATPTFLQQASPFLYGSSSGQNDSPCGKAHVAVATHDPTKSTSPASLPGTPATRHKRQNAHQYANPVNQPFAYQCHHISSNPPSSGHSPALTGSHTFTAHSPTSSPNARPYALANGQGRHTPNLQHTVVSPTTQCQPLPHARLSAASPQPFRGSLGLPRPSYAERNAFGNHTVQYHGDTLSPESCTSNKPNRLPYAHPNGNLSAPHLPKRDQKQYPQTWSSPYALPRSAPSTPQSDGLIKTDLHPISSRPPDIGEKIGLGLYSDITDSKGPFRASRDHLSSLPAARNLPLPTRNSARGSSVSTKEAIPIRASGNILCSHAPSSDQPDQHDCGRNSRQSYGSQGRRTPMFLPPPSIETERSSATSVEESSSPLIGKSHRGEDVPFVGPKVTRVTFQAEKPVRTPKGTPPEPEQIVVPYADDSDVETPPPVYSHSVPPTASLNHKVHRGVNEPDLTAAETQDHHHDSIPDNHGLLKHGGKVLKEDQGDLLVEVTDLVPAYHDTASRRSVDSSAHVEEKSDRLGLRTNSSTTHSDDMHERIPGNSKKAGSVITFNGHQHRRPNKDSIPPASVPMPDLEDDGSSFDPRKGNGTKDGAPSFKKRRKGRPRAFDRLADSQEDLVSGRASFSRYSKPDSSFENKVRPRRTSGNDRGRNRTNQPVEGGEEEEAFGETRQPRSKTRERHNRSDKQRSRSRGKSVDREGRPRSRSHPRAQAKVSRPSSPPQEEKDDFGDSSLFQSWAEDTTRRCSSPHPGAHKDPEAEVYVEATITTYSDVLPKTLSTCSDNALQSILRHLTVMEVKSLLHVCQVARSRLQSNEGNALVVQRFLGEVGYRPWPTNAETKDHRPDPGNARFPLNSITSKADSRKMAKDPFPLTFQDVEGFIIGHDLLGEYRMAALKYQSEGDALDARIPQLVRATIRGYNCVVVRLRAQSSFLRRPSDMEGQTDNTDVLTKAEEQLHLHAEVCVSGLCEAELKGDAHSLVAGAPELPAPWKPGRAACFHVWVPAQDMQSGWLSDDELTTCEQQLFKSGIWSWLQPGDVVWNTALGQEKNEGKFIFDGHFLRYVFTLSLSKAFNNCFLRCGRHHKCFQKGNHVSRSLIIVVLACVSPDT